MSYKTELEQNNIDLQSILDTVNALPDAGSGGSGGGGIDVCSITINLQPRSSSYRSGYALTRYVNGEMVAEYLLDFTTNKNVTFNDVVCGSVITTAIDSAMVYTEISETIEELHPGDYWGSGGSRVYLFKAPVTSGASGTILIRDDN